MPDSSVGSDLSRSTSATDVRIVRVSGGDTSAQSDLVAIEEPLEIRLEWIDGAAVRKRCVSITMRTPGHDDRLAAGFLVGEGIIGAKEQILEILSSGPLSGQHHGSNIVTVRLAAGAVIDWPKLERHFYSTSSCGVCGKASLEALDVGGVAPIPRDGITISAGQIACLPVKLREAQSTFNATGGLHAAGLFTLCGRDTVQLVEVFEDVGRHNALDKLIGSQFLRGNLPLRSCVLCLSGRASFELVQKALVAGIPIIAAVGAPSSLAIELASEFGITLIGFVRGDHFNIYNASWRVDCSA